MRRATSAHNRPRSGKHCLFALSAPVAALLCMAQSAPATAQAMSQPAKQLTTGLCKVFVRGEVKDKPSILLANCQGQGLILGPATEFKVIESDALRATLVDVHSGRERRILMLSLGEAGQPVLENLTSQLSRAAGRGARSNLAGVELDLQTFARSGEIAVRGRPEDTGEGKTDRIDLGQQVKAHEQSKTGTARD